MNILYVTVIIAFAINLVSTFDSLVINNARTKQRVEKNVQDFYLTRELAQITASAIELYTLNSGSCPTTTKKIRINNSGDYGCWPKSNGITGNCFRVQHSHITNIRNNNAVCIAENINLTFHLPRTNPYANLASLILTTSVSKAYSAGGGGGGSGDYGGPGGGFAGGLFGTPAPPPAITPNTYSNITVDNADTTGYGTYSGMAPRNHILHAVSSTSAAAAVRVGLPTANQPPTSPAGVNVNTNYINCSASHTKCFTVTFCLDGQPNCSGISKMQQTFAFRLF